MNVTKLYSTLQIIVLGSLSCLQGCASVSAIALQPDGANPIPGAQPGFRYYMPRPYLLVAEIPGQGANPSPRIVSPLPNAPPPGPIAPVSPETPRPGAPGAGPSPTPAPSPSDGGAKDSQQAGASAPTTDLSFIATNGSTYVAKLIYLPDYSRPMAVNMNTGLLGITSVQLTLQDGWMLTNVSANADNSKMADVLTAAIQALSSGATGGATTALSAAKKAPGGAPVVPSSGALRPGLYAFDYEFGMSRVSFVCAVAYFTPRGTLPARPGDPGACGPDFWRPSAAVLSTLG